MLGTWENAQSLIMSLNAWGFLLFSPYTHHWPMTHQPLHLHSKPLFHYLNHEASFLEGWRANLRRLTVYHCGPLLVSDVHKTGSTSIYQNTAHAVHFFPAGCAQRSCLSRQDGLDDGICQCRGKTEPRALSKLTSRSFRGSLSKMWYVPTSQSVIACLI